MTTRRGFNRGGYIGQAWLVLLIAGVSGGALALVHVKLQPRIEQNKIDETRDQIPLLVKGADKLKTQEYVSADGKVAYKAFSADGRHLGWVIKAAGQGYADLIELLLGLDADAETITGVYVLSQIETPGLGNKIAGKQWKGREWTSQFAGKSALDPLSAAKGSADAPTQVEAISGATVSSTSVCDIVNNAVAEFRAKMATLKRKD